MPSDTNRNAIASTLPRAQKPGSDKALVSELRRLEGLFADFTWAERRAFAQARRRARAHALDVLTGHAELEYTHVALLVAATDLLSAANRELAESPRVAARLVEEIEKVIGLSRSSLAREVLRSPDLLSVAPAAAVEVQLGLIMAFAPLRRASLWKLDVAGRVTCTASAGDGPPSRGEYQLAAALLHSEPTDSGKRRLLVGVVVGEMEHPLAAVVGRANPGGRERCLAVMAEATPVLDAVVRRDALLGKNAAAQRALVQASERKLTRLGFDLHDGPIQEVALLADDLRRFRDQLELILGPGSEHKLVRARIEDLDAEIVAIDAGLRRLSGEARAASVLLQRPFLEALREHIQAFGARTKIRPRANVTVEANLSTSQQIALLNIVHEALSNIREHAHATSVEVTLWANEDGVEAKVTDDGRGFEPESTLRRAAREGRMGLLAMHERVRLLGGQCRIDSRPGGPTTILVTLERWVPLTEAAPTSHHEQQRRGSQGRTKRQRRRGATTK